MSLKCPFLAVLKIKKRTFFKCLNQVISSIIAIFRTNLTKEGRCMRA